jgi:large subunit ribosomal protein L32
MANPKRRWSKARTGKKRSQWKLSAPALVVCPQCRNLKIPHRVCKECGYYDKKQVVVKKVKKAKR